MIDVFNNISLKNKGKLLKMLRGHNVKYTKSQTIIDHLNDQDDIAIVNYGTIQVLRNNYNGTTTIIEEYNQGDLISSNHIYLRDNDTFILAKEDSEVLLLSYVAIINQDTKDFTYNQFLKNLFIILNETIIYKNERIQILSKRSIRDKLLEYFNIMSTKSGSRTIHLPFNFSDLANYLAIDRSAMARELGYLKEEGFITTKGRRITLLYN